MRYDGRAETLKAKRQRRREEDRKRLGLTLTFNVLISLPTDPPQYLEERRGRLIRMLEEIVERTADPLLKARICVDLLKFSSMGLRKIDLSQRTSLELPDLSHLSVEELERLIQAGKDHQGGGMVSPGDAARTIQAPPPQCRLVMS